MSVSVTRATDPNDLRAARLLLADYLRIPGPGGLIWPDELIAGALARDGVSELLYIARVNGEPAGCAVLDLSAARDGVAELRRLYVVPLFRRQGVAEALVRELVRRSRARGCRRLLLKVLDNRLPARELYLKLGFRHEGSHGANGVAFEDYALDLVRE